MGEKRTKQVRVKRRNRMDIRVQFLCRHRHLKRKQNQNINGQNLCCLINDKKKNDAKNVIESKQRRQKKKQNVKRLKRKRKNVKHGKRKSNWSRNENENRFVNRNRSSVPSPKAK